MSEPIKEEMEHEAKELFVEEFWNSITVEKKFEILKNGLGISFIEDEYQDWLNEQYDKYRP